MQAKQAGKQREREVGPLSTAAPTAAVLPSSFAELDIEAIGGRRTDWRGMASLSSSATA